MYSKYRLGFIAALVSILVLSIISPLAHAFRSDPQPGYELPPTSYVPTDVKPNKRFVIEL